MNLKQRVERLEEQTQSRKPGNFVLVDRNCQGVKAKIIRMPTPDLEGLARLPDGSEIPIIWEDNWDKALILYEDKSLGDRLRLRRTPIPFILRGVDMSKILSLKQKRGENNEC